MTVTTVRSGSSAARVDPAVLTAVAAAVHAREVVRFDYVGTGAGSNDAPPRRAEPHHVVSWGGRWYLVAWDLDRADWRTFRLDRMTLRTPNGPRFAARSLPGDDVAAFVTDRFRGGSGGGTGEWPCRGEVVVHLPVAEVSPYLGDALVEQVAPDRTRVVTGAWSWVALAARFGGFDADLEVVGPPELVAAFADLAGRYARAGLLARPRGRPPG